MKRRRSLSLSALLAVLASWYISAHPHAVGGALPEHLSDNAFWSLSSTLSEEDGYFRSDNLVSNEMSLQYVIPELLEKAPKGRVYLGVGPEQNFTYIAALKPSMVFIVDVRRGNMHLHLYYKALFELSADRADFLGRLFARKRPDGLTAKSTATELFNAYLQVPSSHALHIENLRAVREHLTKKRAMPLPESDLAGIEYVAHAFYSHGPGLTYNAGGRGGFGRRMPTYADLQLATDEAGLNRAYLASEDSYLFLKGLHQRNLFVPVVGNFGGPKALRAVGQFVRDAGTTVAAFYLSNVEQYLQQQGMWMNFCGNVATMPLDETSTFIRSVRGGGFGPGPGYPGLINVLGGMLEETRHCR